MHISLQDISIDQHSRLKLDFCPVAALGTVLISTHSEHIIGYCSLV